MGRQLIQGNPGDIIFTNNTVNNIPAKKRKIDNIFGHANRIYNRGTLLLPVSLHD